MPHENAHSARIRSGVFFLRHRHHPRAGACGPVVYARQNRTERLGCDRQPDAKQRSYANAGIVIGEDGVLVIDTLTGDEAATHLLQEIRKLTTLPVKFVVNTHYHGDHVAGNRLFARPGAQVVAHRNVRTWIHSENVRMLGDKPNPDLKTLIERFALQR